MTAKERENNLYSSGKQNPINLEEKIMFSFLPHPQGKKVLDIGCGVGNIANKIQNRGFDVKGIDFSSEAI